MTLYEVCRTYRNNPYLKVGVDVLRDDELGLGFVLTINNVHLKLSVVLFEKVAKLHRVFHTLLKAFQEVTAKQQHQQQKLLPKQDKTAGGRITNMSQPLILAN